MIARQAVLRGHAPRPAARRRPSAPGRPAAPPALAWARLVLGAALPEATFGQARLARLLLGS